MAALSAAAARLVQVDRGISRPSKLRTRGARRPTDFIEEIWLRDIVDLTWEIFRWRRLKTKVLAKEVSRLISDAFIDTFEKIEGLDRLTTIAEGRRNAVLREIDRRRAAFAQTLCDRV
jgi:hypothetical protein